jgi:DNA invertase Pin-like site-specific DNA recombinase
MNNPAQCAANVQDCRKEAEMKANKTTILYERLSRDDGDDYKESNSIGNQRQMLERYAEQHGFTPYTSIADDGFSGKNFERPGWKELIGEVESGNVQAILLKSMDRMGRNYLQVGMYREMFRERGVRLIAVDDNYDSDAGEDEAI